MRIFKWLKNYLYLKDLIKGKKEIPYDFPERIKRSKQKVLKGKNTVLRNLVSIVLKMYREKQPYKVVDYSKTKKLYEDYFLMENHIPSFDWLREKVKKDKDVWVTCFRRAYPVKGKRYSEYHINQRGTPNTFKLDKKERSYGFVAEPFVNDLAHSINSGNLTQFKIATTEEIESEKQRLKHNEEIEYRILKKRNEISELYKKILK